MTVREELTTYHTPVMVQELLAYLAIKPGGVYVDATFGGGGHTRAVLEADDTCRVIACDWDENALNLNRQKIEQDFPGRVTFLWGNFAQITYLLKKNKIGLVDGVFADFGVSTYQIHCRAGFSFSQNTPLDMRMSPAHVKETAADVVNRYSESDLADIIYLYGEERHSRAMARLIVECRRYAPIVTTQQLIRCVQPVFGHTKSWRIHPVTRLFQALRIYVNRELDNITSFLKGAIQVLKPGGRLICISFHSLEDRLVKLFFRDKSQKNNGCLKILTSSVTVPTKEEYERNMSARSARLRAAEYIKR